MMTMVAACGRPAPPPDQTDAQIQQVAQQVIPAVERAAGLTFRSPPRIELRTKAQVHAYLEHKLETDLPPAELAGVTAAYRLFGLIPDTLDIHTLLLALYSEQVAGYYDPDSATLYVVQGAEPAQVRLVLAHELVHALQGQYVPLDSIMALHGDNDRRTAAQAVMEGQATLASVVALVPDQDLNQLPDFWRENRELIRSEQQKMPVFSTAPLLIRETLVFPYFGGADFVRWFGRTYRDTVPFGPRLPASTEQILHPDRYRAGDAPVSLRFRATGSGPIVWQDNLGEFEIRILLTVLSGSETVATAGATGWGGDRFVVLKAAPGDALVWYSVWDTPAAAQRFQQLLTKHWPQRPGRRATVDLVTVDARSGVRLVDAPAGWPGWRRIPAVAIERR
jgi:hypothetical protein